MRHPGDETLARYAAGSATRGVSLVVAAHLTFCPRCRDRVAAYEAICGAMLREEWTVDPAPGQGTGDDTPAPPDLDATIRAIESGAQADAAPDGAAPCVEPALAVPEAARLPRPVLAALGPGASLHWRFRMAGLREHVLDDYCAHTRVSLLRARPGTAIPAHRHSGAERTLVLTGALRDGETVLRRGDVAEEGPGHGHRPVIEGDEECICLTVLDAPLRFTGALGVLNMFQR